MLAGSHGCTWSCHHLTSLHMAMSPSMAMTTSKSHYLASLRCTGLCHHRAYSHTHLWAFKKRNLTGFLFLDIILFYLCIWFLQRTCLFFLPNLKYKRDNLLSCPNFDGNFSVFTCLYFHMVSVETKNSKESKDTGRQYKTTKNEGNTDRQGSEHGPIK